MPKPSDTAGLEKEIKALSAAWINLSRSQTLAELLIIIKRPGWTTPAELLFTKGVIESLQVQTQALQRLSGSLLKAGQLVGRG